MNTRKMATAGTLVGLAAILLMAGGGDVLAQMDSKLGGGVQDAKFFKSTAGILDNTLKNTQAITYGIAGLGAIGLGMMAFFGKFQWTWFFGLIGGLVLIAGAVLGIQYVTGQNIGDKIKIEGGTVAQ